MFPTASGSCSSSTPEVRELRLVLNWFEELETAGYRQNKPRGARPSGPFGAAGTLASCSQPTGRIPVYDARMCAFI